MSSVLVYSFPSSLLLPAPHSSPRPSRSFVKHGPECESVLGNYAVRAWLTFIHRKMHLILCTLHSILCARSQDTTVLTSGFNATEIVPLCHPLLINSLVIGREVAPNPDKPMVRGNMPTVSPGSMMVSVGVGYKVFVRLTEFFSVPGFLRAFIAS